ncbi:hypothetical protein [Bacillus litorisediminis]|uniref:hypothetical protein n=1 Tax=Bacillus litorisediminis TaxID=2922713 RepID=UPI001FACEF2B|nr:hypothetical protein [Bacillus litorisediminis]
MARTRVLYCLTNHYLFKAEFSNVRSGNEKGRGKGSVRYVRRYALVPEPEVQSLNELNNYLREWCLNKAEHKKVSRSKETVADMWAKEKEYFHPLPDQPFDIPILKRVAMIMIVSSLSGFRLLEA